MDDRDKPSYRSPGSSSGSASPSPSSPDALDPGSLRELTSALQGIKQDTSALPGIHRRLDTIERNQNRQDARLGAIERQQEIDGRRLGTMRTEHAASLSRIELATRAIDKGAEATQKAAEQLRETTGEFATHRAADDAEGLEISTKGVKLKAGWRSIFASVVKYGPGAVKIGGGVGAVALAGWYALKHFAHRIADFLRGL